MEPDVTGSNKMTEKTQKMTGKNVVNIKSDGSHSSEVIITKV